MEPWPRILQNLRATRANEVERKFGSKCESAWIGHSERTARENYLVASEVDFAKAISHEKGILETLIDDRNILESEIKKLSPVSRKLLLEALTQSNQAK